MTTSSSKALQGDSTCAETYFAYLSRTCQMPAAIKGLIDRYDIRVYDEVDEWVPPDSCDTQTSLINYSTNNNDDDVAPAVQSPPEKPAAGTDTSPSPNKVFKLKVPSLTRRLSKFGKRSSTDKNKAAVESDSQLESASSAGTSATTVDDPHLQTPDSSTPVNNQRNSKDHDEQKDKYEEESVVGACKSSIEDVPLRAKPVLNFHDAVFYYPGDQTTDDDDGGGRRGLAHVLSEGRVPATALSSSDDRLPLKEAISMQPGVGDDMPLIGGSRRRPSVLRRMRAFFGRSSSGSMGPAAAHHDEVSSSRVARQLSAADALMTPGAWTELDDACSAVGGVGPEDPGAARPARSYTSPPTSYFDGGKAKAEHATKGGTDNLGGSLASEAAGGEQPGDVKNVEEHLLMSCRQTVSDTKP